MPDRKVKVFMVGPSLGTQGGISSVLDIYNRNFKEKLNLSFISSYSGRNRIMDVLMFNGAVLKVLFINVFYAAPVFHIHVASKGSYLRKSILAKFCMAFRHKLILHVHGAMFDQFLEGATQSRKNKIIALFNKADQVVVLSEYWFSYFAKYIPKERLRIIYNPSSTFKSGFVKACNRTTSRSDKGGGMQVLFMGRLGERKGTYDLIRAAAKLKDTDFVLNLYGDGEVDKVRELVEKENLEGIVAVNGWVPHSRINEIYESADIMVLPSYAEGLPMSLLEAIGKGLPVISTHVGGIPELIEDGRNGFLIEPGDVEALADKLKILLTSPELVEKMGKESLAIAGKKFSIEKAGEQLQELYNSL